MNPSVLLEFEREAEKIARELSPRLGLAGALGTGLLAHSAQSRGAQNDRILQALGVKSEEDARSARRKRLVRTLGAAAGVGAAGALGGPAAKRRVHQAAREFFENSLKPHLDTAADRFGSEIRKGVEDAAPTISTGVGTELRGVARDLAEQLKSSLRGALPRPFRTK